MSLGGKHPGLFIAVVLCAALAVPAVGDEAGPLRDKTLVVWTSPSNLSQRGGSALTIDDAQTSFDGIVFGEVAPNRWMAGSEMYRRTPQDQVAWPGETAGKEALVQMAIVYAGRQINLYRNGEAYASYKSQEDPPAFGADAVVIIGKRHLEAKTGSSFAGSIDDARIYDRALAIEQIKALQPNKASTQKPWAWWTFDGEGAEQTGRFKKSKLVDGAKLADGRLTLDGQTGSFIAMQSEATSVAAESVGTPLPPGAIDAARAVRNQLLADPHRPTYHFIIPEGVGMPFDPNGAIYWRGRYHLFYIFQDGGVHKFGHISSRDLFHWRHHPPALFPTPDSPEQGIFSGNAFLSKKGSVVMMYHGVNAGNCIAICDDDLLERWQKNPAGNPIVPNPPADKPFTSWDPHGWLDGDTYYAIFGGNPGTSKPASVFKSADLAKWSYVGPLMQKDIGVGDVSCPDFFKLGGKDVLVCISHQHGARYYVGQWEGEQYHPEHHEMMSWADNTFFAPETLVDDKGRRILWAWVLDLPGIRALGGASWSGTMSLPRVLTLGEGNRLHYNPPVEIESLRYNERTAENITVASGEEKLLKDVAGNAIEIEAEIGPGEGMRWTGLRVCRSADGSEQTMVYYDAVDKMLTIETAKSGRQGVKHKEQAPFELKPGEPLTLRVFIDRSIVEVFANGGRQAACRRIYADPASVGVSVFSDGGPSTFKRIRAWDMMPSNPY